MSPVLIRALHTRFQKMGYSCAEACTLIARLSILAKANPDKPLRELVHMLYLSVAQTDSARDF